MSSPLSAAEQRAILANPAAISCLIDWNDDQAEQSRSFFGRDMTVQNANDVRVFQLLEIGRAIIAEDPEIWPHSVLAEFRPRYSEIPLGEPMPSYPPAPIDASVELAIRKKIVAEIRSSAFMHCDVNKEDFLACVETGKTLAEARPLRSKTIDKATWVNDLKPGRVFEGGGDDETLLYISMEMPAHKPFVQAAMDAARKFRTSCGTDYDKAYRDMQDMLYDYARIVTGPYSSREAHTRKTLHTLLEGQTANVNAAKAERDTYWTEKYELALAATIALKETNAELVASNTELETLCDKTYVAEGADAYNHACEMLESWQAKRVAEDKEPGCIGSLCGGMEWLYDRVGRCEAELLRLITVRTPSPMTPIRLRALNLLTPPFTFTRGFVFDHTNKPVSDDTSEGTDSVQRVRGWGAIQKLEDGAALQDEVGKILAEALTAYWSQHTNTSISL